VVIEGSHAFIIDGLQWEEAFRLQQDRGLGVRHCEMNEIRKTNRFEALHRRIVSRIFDQAEIRVTELSRHILGRSIRIIINIYY